MIIFICHLSKVMHFVFFIFLFHFPSYGKIFSIPHSGNKCFWTINKNVGAGINTLMSVSDGLGLSIFYRKMEKVRPMREEMDGKVVYFPPESAFLSLILYVYTVLFRICILIWRVNNYVSHQKKVQTGEMKVQFENFWELFTSFQNLFQKSCTTIINW